MTVKCEFEYDASCTEIADEFCNHNSKYGAEVINNIGLQLAEGAYDATNVRRQIATGVKLASIAEQLDENGQWFIETMYNYMQDQA